MRSKRLSTRFSSTSTKTSSSGKSASEGIVLSAPASPVPQRLRILTNKSQVPVEGERGMEEKNEMKPMMKLKLNLASIPTNYIDSIQVSSLTEQVLLLVVLSKRKYNQNHHQNLKNLQHSYSQR